MVPQFLKDVYSLRSILIFVLVPLLLLPIPIIIATDEARCAYVLLLMAIFWTTEIIPVSVTSLIPIILFPTMGIMKAGETCGNYIKSSTMLFVGGLIIACAVERWNLHKRIALRVLLFFGTEPKWLMFGMMLPTWFLSMWISNTATTSMMLPIVQAILVQIKESSTIDGKTPETSDTADGAGNVSVSYENHELEDMNESPEKTAIDDEDGSMVKIRTDDEAESATVGMSKAEYRRLCTAMCLCIAYAANVGGISTLIGTGPNVVLQGQAEILFQKYGLDSGVSFGSWMVFGFPTSLICLIVTWLWLNTFFLRCSGMCGCCSKSNPRQNEAVKSLIRKEYEKMGSITFAESVVLGHFIVVALLWLTRRPQFVPGWGDLFLPKYVDDSTASILVALLLFIFPSELPRVFCCRPSSYDVDQKKSSRKVRPLLTWSEVHHGLPWMIVWLLGGGFALAAGSQKSGLSRWIGDQLTVFGDLQPWVMVLIITFIAAAVTEVTSNTAITVIITPILGELGIRVGVNPLYLMFPAAIATSFAFMLPVATPPNAIVFAHGHVKVTDMASAGLFLNIVCVAILNLATNTWASAFFDFNVFPLAMSQNATLLHNTTSFV